MVEDREHEGDPHDDLNAWKGVVKVVNWLGQEGMSSDESDVEGLEEIYRTKILYWRHSEIDHYMDILDSQRKLPNNGIFTKKGKKRTKRVRSSEAAISDRKPVKGMPVGLYDRTWFNGLKTSERTALKASTDTFKVKPLTARSSDAGM